jgi:hypothetical protein
MNTNQQQLLTLIKQQLDQIVDLKDKIFSLLQR